MGFIIDSALGHNIIIEPFEKSTVLKAEETATVFKVISINRIISSIPDFSKIAMEHNLQSEVLRYLSIGDLIIVEPNSVQKAVMGDKDVYYVKDSDIVSRVKVI